MDNGKTKLSWIVCLVAILLLASSALALNNMPSENLYLGEVTATRLLPSAINAGDTVSLAVDIHNQGINLSMTDLNASVDLGDYFSAVSVTDHLSSISPGATNTVVLKFKVSDNIQPGFYTVLVKYNYMRLDQRVEQTLSVVVPVETGQKSLSIEANPKSINPGNQSNLTFSVINNGSDSVSNVVFAWSESGNLILPVGSDNRKFASSIAPGQKADFNYTVAADPNIATGIYPIDASVSYTDSSGPQTQNSKIGLIVGGGTDFQISADTTTSGQISFSIANVGSNNAGAVVVTLAAQPGLTVSGTNTVISGNLNKGDYTIANFNASVASADRNGFGAGAGVAGRRFGATGDTNFQQGQTFTPPSSYVLNIAYTDTTGERQTVQQSFSLNSASSSLASSFASRGANQQQSSPLVYVAIIFAIIIVGTALFNKYKAKKSWKKIAKVLAVGVVIPIVVLLLVPSVFISMVLASAFLVGAALFVFLGQRK